MRKRKTIEIVRNKNEWELIRNNSHEWGITLEDVFMKIMAEKTQDKNLFNVQRLDDKDIKLLSKMLRQEFRIIGLIAKDILESNYEPLEK